MITVEQFNEFFNACEVYLVTAYKYNVVEYFPAHFQRLRHNVGASEGILIK